MNEMKRGCPAGRVPTGVTRRGFLDFFIGGGLAALLAGMVAPIGAYLWPARKRGGAQELVEAGPVEGWPVGMAHAIQVSGHPILVIRVSESVFRAFNSACSHLGCIVQWDGPTQTFKCPCHAGMFTSEGKVISGPPPSPLISYETIVAGGTVKVKVSTA